MTAKITRPGIPSVPACDSGMYSFLAALKENVERISGTRNGSATPVEITASTTGTSGGSTGTGGTSTGIVMTLSNGVIVLSADGTGTVTDFSTAHGLAKMFSGTTDVTSSTTFSLTASSCTATINAVVNSPVASQPIGYYRVTAVSSVTASLTITGVYAGTTITQTVAVSAIAAGYPIVSTLPTGTYVGQIVFLTTSNTLWRYDGTQWLPLIAAVNTSGQIAAAQIEDSVITLAKLIPGLHPVELVTTLPSPGTQGRVVFLTADNKLYRDTGTAWTKATDGADIVANSITAGQIQAGAITTTAMIANSISGDRIQAGTLDASKIVAASIVAGDIAANTILGSNIAANTIQGNNIQAGAITAAKIASNTITATQIASGTITATQIGANTITAANMNVANLSAISANMGTLTDGIIILDNGTYMRVMGIGFGASSNLLDWYGPHLSSPSLCTAANALFYQDTAGNSYHAGHLSFNSSFSSTSGYIQFPTDTSGRSVIEQWGLFTQGVSSPNNVSFPMTFPNACMSVMVTPAFANETCYVAAIATDHFVLNFGASSQQCYWRAIGY